MWTGYPEIRNELLLVEEHIEKSISSRNRLLSEIVRELVYSGGKRLRPAFVVLSAKFGEYDREKILPAAGALEILHTATLVHDDIIDRSKLRRGKVTVSEKYGSDMAVYTGDFLFTKAILMLSSKVPAENLEVIAKAIKTICEGEVDQYQAKFNIDTSVLEYLKRIKRKTSILFAAACSVGAFIAKCPDETRNCLAKFGMYYGTAFQIKDDLNDFLSDEASSGKPVIKDIVEGVITLPVILAMQRNNSVREALAFFIGNKEKSRAEEMEHLALLVRETGGVKEAGNLLAKYVDRGIQALTPLPDNEYKNILIKLISDLKI